jgi:tricorn protease-like protein
LKGDDASAAKGDAPKPDEAKKAENGAKATVVDLDGIVARTAPFPVPENRFGRIAGVAGGKVIWTCCRSPARMAAADTRRPRVVSSRSISRPDASKG